MKTKLIEKFKVATNKVKNYCKGGKEKIKKHPIKSAIVIGGSVIVTGIGLIIGHKKK